MRARTLASSWVGAIALLGVGLPEAAASGVLVPRSGAPPIHVRSHRVVATVEDGLARTTTRQTFVNPHGRVLEAVYEFPIPEGASLVDLAMEVGGQRLEGFLAERKTARRTYDTLVQRRIDPALVEQVGRSKFRLSVYPVMPDQPTVVELTWIESVPVVEGEMRYVYPLALDGAATTTDQDLTVSVTMKSSAAVEVVSSPNDEMYLERLSAHEVRASLERMQASLSEDLVVVAEVAAVDPTLDVQVFRAPGSEPFFAAILTPPPLTEDQVLPRDLTLALDMSGSMQGEKFEQAVSAGLWLLDHVRPKDRIRLLLFSNVVRFLDEDFLLATPENLERMREFLRSAKAGGGTALGDAVRTACALPKEPGRTSLAVILTDGLPTIGVTDPKQIVEFAKAGSERGVRVYPFGVGGDVDAALLHALAAAGSGTAEVFRLGGEIETRVRRFLTRTSSPAITDLRLTVDGKSVPDLVPRTLPDVYRGEQVALSGRLPGEGVHRFAVEGTMDGVALRLERDVDLGTDPKGVLAHGNPLARDLYARQSLEDLEQAHRLRLGLADDVYFATLDQGRYSTEDELVDAMITVSLETGVQCAYTSYLALLPEDRARLSARDATAIGEALQRAADRRRQLVSEVVGADVPADSPEGLEFGDAAGEGPAEGKVTGSAGFSLGRGSPNTGGPVGPAGAPRPSTGGGGFQRRSASAGFEQWEFWWEHNRDSLLPRRPPGSAPGIDAAELRSLLVPLLEETNGDVVDSAVLALARSVRAEDAGDLVPRITAVLAHREQTARESAAIALGVLGAEEAVPVLLNLLGDTAEGRRLCNRNGEVEPRVRAFAAASLGMIGAPQSLEALKNVIREDTSQSLRDAQQMAILALGQWKEESDDLVSFLLETTEARNVDRIVRAQVPIALAHLLVRDVDGPVARSPRAPAVVERMVQLFEDVTNDLDLGRSLAVALGRLATVDDSFAVGALTRAVTKAKDDQIRNFALMSLARIGARDGEPERHADAHAALEDLFLSALHGSTATRHIPYGALALAVYVRNPKLAVRGANTRFGREILQALSTDQNPSYQAALATALGLLHFLPARQTLVELYDGTKSQHLKGYVAVALGMLGNESAEKFRADLTQKGLEFKFRLQLARALGVMRDPSAAPALLELIGRAETLSETASAAQALGLLGTGTPIDSLREIVQDRTLLGPNRAFAVVALGMLAEKTDQPFTAAFSVDSNYRAKTEALAELLDIL